MHERWVFATTMFSAVGAGVVAGVFLAFSTFLMQALDERPAADAITTMNSINDKIENPLFMLAFMGTALTSVVLAGYALFSLDGPERTWLVAGAAAYAIGAFLITVAYHLPKNDTLSKSTRTARRQPPSGPTTSPNGCRSTTSAPWQPSSRPAASSWPSEPADPNSAWCQPVAVTRSASGTRWWCRT